MGDDERELVQRCLAGDQAACADLVDVYARMVGTVIWRATGDGDSVEDLAQETFMRVFRALPEFAGRAKFSTWVCTIAHRVAIDHLRKAGRWREAVSPGVFGFLAVVRFGRPAFLRFCRLYGAAGSLLGFFWLTPTASLSISNF